MNGIVMFGMCCFTWAHDSKNGGLVFVITR